MGISLTELKTALWEHSEVIGAQETMQQRGALVHVAVPANTPEGAWLRRVNLGQTEGWQADHGPNWTDFLSYCPNTLSCGMVTQQMLTGSTVYEREKSMNWVVLIF